MLGPTYSMWFNPAMIRNTQLQAMARQQQAAEAQRRAAFLEQQQAARAQQQPLQSPAPEPSPAPQSGPPAMKVERSGPEQTTQPFQPVPLVTAPMSPFMPHGARNRHYWRHS